MNRFISQAQRTRRLAASRDPTSFGKRVDRHSRTGRRAGAISTVARSLASHTWPSCTVHVSVIDRAASACSASVSAAVSVNTFRFASRDSAAALSLHHCSTRRAP